MKLNYISTKESIYGAKNYLSTRLKNDVKYRSSLDRETEYAISDLGLAHTDFLSEETKKLRRIDRAVKRLRQYPSEPAL